ncbi:hypothetical protein A2U01_0091830, partial [Trifolium medium]|nr:hypothetical protein [Trifolium medium]
PQQNSPKFVFSFAPSAAPAAPSAGHRGRTLFSVFCIMVQGKIQQNTRVV